LNFLTLGDGTETSVKDYHSMLCYTPEERISHQHRGGSLISQMTVICLSQLPFTINLLHALPTYFFKTLFNTIHPSMPRSSKWCISSRFSHQNRVRICLLLRTCHMHTPSHPLRFHHQIIFGEEYKLLCLSLHSFLQSPLNSCLLGPNIFLSTIFSKKHQPISSLHLNDQVSHPYKTRGKITALYTLIFVFLVK
jgi:hypothetical protein